MASNWKRQTSWENPARLFWKPSVAGFWYLQGVIKMSHNGTWCGISITEHESMMASGGLRSCHPGVCVR